MRFLRALVLAGATLAATCAIAPAAAFAAPPPCPANLNALELQAPTYGRAGQSLAAEILRHGSEPVAEVTLTASEQGDSVVTSVSLTGDKTTVVVPTGNVEPEFELALKWKQGEGTVACEGTIAYTIPIIPPDATAGDPLASRLAGRFKVSERAISPPEDAVFKATWRFRPRCQYFACATPVKSSAHLRGTFHLLRNGDYELQTKYPPSSTCENFKTHRVIQKRGYREVVRVRLQVEEDPLTHQVESFTGTIRVYWEATPQARAKGCSQISGHSRQQVRGRRIQS